MSRTLDTRRLSDVKPRVPPTAKDFDGDLELASYGYSGETSTYQLRLQRMQELAREGRGPLAQLRALLVELGYRSPWTPYYPPGAVRLPVVAD